ncbi:MAG TPA: hypothetical protein VH989_06180 [Actinomycetota bacterium]
MSTRRRGIALLVAGIAAVGCTGNGSSTPSRSQTPTATVTVPTVITPGEFSYSLEGVVVTLALKTNLGTMVVDNESDHNLPKPGIYVIDGTTAERIDGTVEDAAVIPEGDKATFQVRFPQGVDEKSIGLVILLFGGASYGAFAPA